MGAEDDRRFMRRAIALAEGGWGRVHPNPLVGAVLVKDGVVVGEGYHTAFGAPHAEIEALRAAGDDARGATAYMSLEPCAHHGKTPPCADALAEAGVARVVYAAEDPTAAAGGADRLRARGVAVEGGVERAAARRQNAPFFHVVEHARCWVALKYGLSLDARIARREGERTAVTGAEALADAYRLRAGFDALLVGSRTARIDDPLLTARGDVEPIRPPIRVVMDSHARLAPTARLLQTIDAAPVLVLTGKEAPPERRRALERAGAEVLEVPGATNGVDLGSALDVLWDRGIRTVLCEGGARLGTALLRAGVVQRLVLYYAPVLFGEAGVPAFPGAPEGPVGRIVDVRSLGRDVRIVVESFEDVPGDDAGPR